MSIKSRIARASQELERLKQPFSKKYPRNPVYKKDAKVEEDYLKAGQQNLRLLQDAPRRAEAMSYFEAVLSSDMRIKEIEKLKGKIMGTFCNFVPEELIYACGLYPLRLCAGSYATIHIAEEILPRDICPLIKSSLGFKILGFSYFKFCDVLILPTSCDGKKKLGEILHSYLPVWIMELPQSKNLVSARQLWLKEVYILKRRLEQFSGVKITRKRLKMAIQLLQRRQQVFRRLFALRKIKPAPINGRDALLVVQSSFYDDIHRWIDQTQRLCAQLEEQGATACTSKAEIRLLLTGAPLIWPNFKVLNIVEQAGAKIVIDELCSGAQRLYNPVEVDEWTVEGMVEAIANRYLLPSTCPCFTETEDRIDKLWQMVKDFSCDGVIYHSLRLCQLYDMEQGLVKQVLKEKGLPMLTLHTDYSSEDVEQIKTRVEAYLEMIKSKRGDRIREKIRAEQG